MAKEAGADRRTHQSTKGFELQRVRDAIGSRGVVYQEKDVPDPVLFLAHTGDQR